MSVTIRIFEPSGARNLTIAELPAALGRDSLLWVDIEAPSHAEIDMMQHIFHFHPLAVEDSIHNETRAKLEQYADHLFIVINPLTHSQKDNSIELRELDIFVGKNYVVTVHTAPEPLIREVSERLMDMRRGLPLSSGLVLYTVLDVVVDSYFPLVEDAVDAIEAIEDKLLDDRTPPIIEELVQLKRMMRSLSRVVWPTQSVMTYISNHYHILDGEQLEYYFRDVQDHLLRLAEIISNLRENLTSLLDLYMSATSNRLNKVVNRLTVITIAVGTLSVLTGFYGMNFEKTWPPFNTPNGVLVVIGMMIAVQIAFFGLLRLRRWI